MGKENCSGACLIKMKTLIKVELKGTTQKRGAPIQPSLFDFLITFPSLALPLYNKKNRNKEKNH